MCKVMKNLVFKFWPQCLYKRNETEGIFSVSENVIRDLKRGGEKGKCEFCMETKIEQIISGLRWANGTEMDNRWAKRSSIMQTHARQNAKDKTQLEEMKIV